MQFNEKLKELRAKKGVSQSELADNIYVSRSAVAKWENGLGLPGNESLRLLCEYFEVSKEELYSDAPTEKVIVQKNQIISRSRKLLVIISTVCAVAITTIIVLALVMGQIERRAADGYDTYKSFSVRGELYSKAKVYDDETDGWITSDTVRNRISSERTVAIAEGELHWEYYTLTVGEYFLTIGSASGGYNGHAFSINADCVRIKYNSEVFDIVPAYPGGYDGRPVVEYILTAKKPCRNEAIYLYHVAHGEEITECSPPSSEMIITVVSREEGA